jgi:cytochrome P450
MRLFPPAWVIGREAIHDCEIGGHAVRPGVSVIMSQWIKHRDPRHFSEPLQFMPERWLGNPMLPKLCYFPFGAGPRVCIGSSFAMMESILGLATITARFRLTAPAGYKVDPWPSITLQPSDGIHLTIAS